VATVFAAASVRRARLTLLVLAQQSWLTVVSRRAPGSNQLSR
jgi:hypothetical protein